MDTLLSVLVTLGVNNTLWIQFAITVAFLVLARIIFVNDLLRVITERVVNTSGAADEAEKLTQETEISKKRYEKLLNEKVIELNNTYSINRKTIKDEIDSDNKLKEEKLINAFKNEVVKKQTEFTKVQEAVEGNTAELSTNLLAKIKQ